MPMTRELKEQLGGKVIPHKGMDSGSITSTGLVRNGSVLVIPPVDTNSGFNAMHDSADVLSETERRACRVDDAMEVIEANAPVPQRQPKRKVSKANRKRTQAQDTEPESVLLTLELPGVGRIPSQYTHVHKGEGVLVLGMSRFSYCPARAASSDSGITGLVNVDGNTYAFMGLEFRDSTGTRNVILVELPKQEETINQQEDLEDDDEEDFQ